MFNLQKNAQPLKHTICTTHILRATTTSVAAGFGRHGHGMPPPASNDTGTAFCFPNEEVAEMRRTDDVSL